VAGRIRSIEKCSDLTGNRTRDFPASSIVPQPTTLPSVLVRLLDITSTVHVSNFILLRGPLKAC
jgi:hypothetical protein